MGPATDRAWSPAAGVGCPGCLSRSPSAPAERRQADARRQRRWPEGRDGTSPPGRRAMPPAREQEGDHRPKGRAGSRRRTRSVLVRPADGSLLNGGSAPVRPTRRAMGPVDPDRTRSRKARRLPGTVAGRSSGPPSDRAFSRSAEARAPRSTLIEGIRGIPMLGGAGVSMLSTEPHQRRFGDWEAGRDIDQSDAGSPTGRRARGPGRGGLHPVERSPLHEAGTRLRSPRERHGLALCELSSPRCPPVYAFGSQ